MKAARICGSSISQIRNLQLNLRGCLASKVSYYKIIQIQLFVVICVSVPKNCRPITNFEMIRLCQSVQELLKQYVEVFPFSYKVFLT